jgi:hypothetical protein
MLRLYARIPGWRFFRPRRKIKLLPDKIRIPIWDRNLLKGDRHQALGYILYQCLKRARRNIRNLGRVRFLRYLFRSYKDRKVWTNLDWEISNSIFGLCHRLTGGKYTLLFYKIRHNGKQDLDPGIKIIHPKYRKLFFKTVFRIPEFVKISDLSSEGRYFYSGLNQYTYTMNLPW